MKKEKCFCNIFHNLIIVSSGLQLEFPIRTKSYYKDCGYQKLIRKMFFVFVENWIVWFEKIVVEGMLN